MADSQEHNRQSTAMVSTRESYDELRRKSLLVRSTPLVQTLIDAMPGIVMILNGSNQVIAANRPLLETFHTRLDDVLGSRFGEVLGCSSWRDGPDGCGTSPHCANCGVLQTIAQCQTTREPLTRQCELTVDRPVKGLSLQLRVKATATSIQGEAFTVCAAEDVSSQKRLDELTRLFFHDVLNMAGGLQAHLGLLAGRLESDEDRKDVRGLHHLADQLVDEIETQRELALAESGDLEVQPQAVRVARVVDDLRLLYAAHPAGQQRFIEAVDVWDGVLVTDPHLLDRVLRNMLRNALEATEPGGTVGLRCVPRGDGVEFSVHNAGVIPEPLQRQIFRRSFSTKGRRGRGIGIRSIKVLGENYLQGTVSFTSSESEGTTFTVRVPKVLEPSPGASDGPESPRPFDRAGTIGPGIAGDS